MNSNKKALDFYKKLNNNNPTEQSVKIIRKDNKNSDFSNLDADFILKYSNKDTSILDIGSGTGLIINKIYDKVKSIVAVELFENLSKYIVKSNNVTIINENIFNFNTDEKFDLVTIFGVMNYTDEEESLIIYEKYKEYIKDNGQIIIKNQFGVNDDVNVDGFSDELGKYYYSQYRHIDKEVNNLKKLGFKNIKVIDIYPKECNRWDNTHFYAITANI